MAIKRYKVTSALKGSSSGSGSLEARDMAIEQLRAALGRVVGGEATAVATLRTGNYTDLVAAYAAAGPQVLRPSGVVRVLEALRSGGDSASQAQDWASFVRWGSLS